LRYSLLLKGDAHPIIFEQGDIGYHTQRNSPWLPPGNVRYAITGMGWIARCMGESAHRAAVVRFVAHGAILRVRAKNPHVADQVAINHRKADITARQHAMLDFALKVATDSGRIGDDDYAALRAHGFSDEDTWDIGAIAAFFALSNRMANLIGLRPNDEFYLLGRVPK